MFGAAGLAAYLYVKKRARLMPMLTGLLLIFPPYMIARLPRL